MSLPRVAAFPASLAALLCAAALGSFAPADAQAQDLFELEVFEYDTTPPGSFAIDLHTNAIPSGGVMWPTTAGRHRPGHVSVEVARGWTERFEAALFVQTAPFGASGTVLAGGHVRGKLRLGELAPLRFALGAEYGFNRAAFSDELQTLELRPIVDYSRGRLALVANPSLEFVTHGGDEGLAPVFDVSAKAGWRLSDRLTVATEYFSAESATRHLPPEAGSHHLVFTGVDLELDSGLHLGVSMGRCVTGRDPWLLKSVVGFEF
jgi:hypothetical protein